MNIPSKVKAYLMDRTSDEYREMVDAGYWVWGGESTLHYFHEDADYGYGPLFMDVYSKYGTDRYLIGWIEEDDAATEVPA